MYISEADRFILNPQHIIIFIKYFHFSVVMSDPDILKVSVFLFNIYQQQTHTKMAIIRKATPIP